MVQYWKDYLAAEKDEFKEGRKLFVPALEEGEEGYGKPRPDPAGMLSDGSDAKRLIGSGPVDLARIRSYIHRDDSYDSDNDNNNVYENGDAHQMELGGDEDDDGGGDFQPILNKEEMPTPLDQEEMPTWDNPEDLEDDGDHDGFVGIPVVHPDCVDSDPSCVKGELETGTEPDDYYYTPPGVDHDGEEEEEKDPPELETASDPGQYRDGRPTSDGDNEAPLLDPIEGKDEL